MRESGRRQIERLVWWAPIGQPWKVLSFIADHISLGRPTDKELSAIKNSITHSYQEQGWGVLQIHGDNTGKQQGQLGGRGRVKSLYCIFRGEGWVRQGKLL